jgi:hypothetical protein
MSISLRLQSIPESPKFSLGEHKTTEQTRVLSESDVYFSLAGSVALSRPDAAPARASVCIILHTLHHHGTLLFR